MELGIGMFGDLAFDQKIGKYEDAGNKMQEMLEQIKLMDEIGIDVFALGEHHRAEYAISSPAILLAAAASITKNIKLASGVTVLSSAEPVKVYQDFSTLDLISKGRAEIFVGRGSFTESFPLFGYSLNDYEKLFDEKLDLLLKINSEENITWSGEIRAPMINQTAYPRAFNNQKIPIWRAVGGTPKSVLSAAKMGLPLVVAIIGGMPIQFKNLVDFYKQEYLKAGHPAEDMQVGVHCHTFVSENQSVIDAYFYNYKSQMDRIGSSRGWAPFSKQQYDAGRASEGALIIGTPEEVATKINYIKEIFGITRFIGHMDVGAPNNAVLRTSIQLFGEIVGPKVR